MKMEKFSDEWFRKYAVDELNGKHKHKEVKKLVKCKYCVWCGDNIDYHPPYTTTIRQGEYICLKGHGKDDSIADNHISEQARSKNRYCVDYKQIK